ncbi:terpenoid cyclases/Protein prenyltransferase [Artomyces pyxidatus]|uniref:Terpenoid cyclases/Protein prenyltransferase n=1 Tax=Artomyces pyxidatus TaxID=48021 RepID=A0ACB8SXJ6_9AGAM|nr:terpenoid cyclases/Protein prenyltransferase [Artomyces pyxidatus]
MSKPVVIPPLTQKGHAAHCNRCLAGLPASLLDLDGSRMAISFYCLGTLDITGLVDQKITDTDRESWKEWIWDQQAGGVYGSGFRPGPFMTTTENQPSQHLATYSNDYSTPHIIMTYCALLSLAILRDDFTKLDRKGLLQFLRSCQGADGSFSTIPGAGDGDLRMTYCAFAISALLNDWSGIDAPRAFAYLRRCRTYEGGYGQSPTCEAIGGPTYCALASVYLAPPHLAMPLTPAERKQTTRWLLQTQNETGGLSGRTGKLADACYCFWCSASLDILGDRALLNTPAMAAFLASCQFNFGGIAKAPGTTPDPYHTYLSLAAVAIAPPETEDGSWRLQPLNTLINATTDTVKWAKEHIPARAY